MIFQERKYILDEKEIVLRSAREDEAQMLIDYLKTVTGETRFLMCESDEVKFTKEDEEKFINNHNASDDSMLILAFVDGNYVGNCSFERKTGSKRYAHRAGIGIALFQKYTGQGLGKLMLSVLLEEIRKFGFEQVELTVVSNNTKAIHLYKSLGFIECGRLHDANKYDDGTYADDIFMLLQV